MESLIYLLFKCLLLQQLLLSKCKQIIKKGFSGWKNRICHHKDKILSKKLLENKEMDFKNGVKNIQAAVYNGGCRTPGYSRIFAKQAQLAHLHITKTYICTSQVL